MIESYLVGLFVVTVVIVAIYVKGRDSSQSSEPLSFGERNLIAVAVVAYPLVICLLCLVCLGALFEDDSAHHKI